MQEKWLPGNTMDRIRDLCRSRNITQVELAQAVGMDKSTLSRVMAEKTSKLSSKNLVAIANYFEVSTDFLLGLTDIPSRKGYDIERLGAVCGSSFQSPSGQAEPFCGLPAFGKSEIRRADPPDRALSGGRSGFRRCRAESNVQLYEQPHVGTWSG